MHSQGPSHFQGRLDFGGANFKAHADGPPHPPVLLLYSHSCSPPTKADFVTPRSSSFGPFKCPNTGATIIALSDAFITPNPPLLLNSPPPQHVAPPVQVSLDDDQYFLSKEAAFLLSYPCFSRIDKPEGHLDDKYLDTIQALVHPDDWRPFVFGSIDFSHVRFHAEFMAKP